MIIKSFQEKPQKTIFHTIMDNLDSNIHAPEWTRGTLKVIHLIFLALQVDMGNFSGDSQDVETQGLLSTRAGCSLMENGLSK